jgi:hypothetical protein
MAVSTVPLALLPSKVAVSVAPGADPALFVPPELRDQQSELLHTLEPPVQVPFPVLQNFVAAEAEPAEKAIATPKNTEIRSLIDTHLAQGRRCTLGL